MANHFMMIMAMIASFLLFFSFTSSAPTGDKITDLPGLNFPINFDQYSGYIDVQDSPKRSLFYWFVESQSNPSKDPLFVWFQGGPGCSSLLGFLTENGPFMVNPDGQTLSKNPSSWNLVANILYVESPAGVGFSYFEEANYTTGDNKTAADALVFLQRWFQAYPEYTSHDFYLSGESYGGHYLPQLAQLLFEKKTIPNWKGFMVGNAWTDDVIDSNSVPEFVYEHGLISYETWVEIKKSCNLENGGGAITRLGGFRDYLRQKVTSVKETCAEAIEHMWKQIGNNINQYDIYVPCINGGGLDCSNYTKEIMYLNNPTVKKALHAKLDLPKWEVCSSTLQYLHSWKSVVSIYDQILNPDLHITVYSGDVTYNVPFEGSTVWISSLGRPIVEEWHAWEYEGQVAGYVQKYENINFVTIKNAGHMVPTYQPERALEFFKKFIAGMF